MTRSFIAGGELRCDLSDQVRQRHALYRDDARTGNDGVEEAFTAEEDVLGAFIQAGFPEELAKLLMILLTVRLFRRTVTNVYEYILIGMAVGFGFTLFEEMIYGSDGAVFRLTGVAVHSALNMLMAKHLALAKYNKLTGRGSVAGENALAFIVPVLIHTCYDACTSNNVFLNSTDENQELIGLILALSAAVLIIVFEVMVFVKAMKNAAAYCAMATVAEKTTDIEEAQAWKNGR